MTSQKTFELTLFGFDDPTNCGSTNNSGGSAGGW